MLLLRLLLLELVHEAILRRRPPPIRVRARLVLVLVLVLLLLLHLQRAADAPGVNAASLLLLVVWRKHALLERVVREGRRQRAER